MADIRQSRVHVLSIAEEWSKFWSKPASKPTVRDYAVKYEGFVGAGFQGVT